MFRSIPRRSPRSITRRRYASSSDRVGFVGLGQMGARMALNLAKKGQKLVVFDVVPESTAQIAKEGGAQVASSPKQVAELADIVVTMLPSTPHVNNVYLEGATSMLHVLSKQHLCIDASTIDPNIARQIQANVAAKGASMIDAPVSG